VNGASVVTAPPRCFNSLHATSLGQSRCSPLALLRAAVCWSRQRRSAAPAWWRRPPARSRPGRWCPARRPGAGVPTRWSH